MAGTPERWTWRDKVVAIYVLLLFGMLILGLVAAITWDGHSGTPGPPHPLSDDVHTPVIRLRP